MSLQASWAQGLQQTRALQRRFDARPRRERIIMTVAVVAVAVMAVDSWWLGPAFKRWNEASQRQRTVQAQAARTLVEQQQSLDRQREQDKEFKTEVAQLRERLRAREGEMRDVERSLVGPDRMLGLLEQLLARHGQLRLRSMQSLPRTEVAEGGKALLYRHGVELSVEGSYGDLLSYLEALEAMPQQLLWGSLQLKVERHPKAVLTLRAYTLSLDRNWLEI